jgi:hypothetical protein
MSEIRHHLTQAAAEAVSAPAFKATATGATITGIGDWLTTGPGLATAAGLILTLVSLLLQMWSVIRRDRREHREHEARMHRG